MEETNRSTTRPNPLLREHYRRHFCGVNTFAHEQNDEHAKKYPLLLASSIGLVAII